MDGLPFGDIADPATSQLYPLEYYQDHREGTSFIEVMIDFKRRQCDGPRDKVYAILGLLNPEGRKIVHPNYALSPKDVYHDATLASVRFTRSLDVFSCAMRPQTTVLDVPSLVPDWTMNISEKGQRTLYRRLKWTYVHYKASRCSSVDLQNTAPYEVTLSDAQVDELDSIVGGEMWTTTLQNARKLAAVGNSPTGVYADRATAFWHTLCGALVPVDAQNVLGSRGLRPIHENDFAAFQSWWDYAESGFLHTDKDVGAFNTSFYTIATSKIFAVTKKVYIS